MQVDPSYQTNSKLSPEVVVPDAVKQQRLKNLGPFGASREAFLFLYTPETEADLRELANLENQQRERFNKDSGQTLLDTLLSMKAQHDSKLEPLKDLLVEEQQRRNKGKLQPILTAPKTDPGSRPWTRADPIPEWDPSVRIWSPAEMKDYCRPGKTYDEKLAHWSNDKTSINNMRQQAMKSVFGEATKKPLSPEQEEEVRKHMMTSTAFKGPPKRTILKWLTIETTTVVQKEETRNSIQASVT